MPEEDQGISGWHEEKDKRHHTVYRVPYRAQRRKNPSMPKRPPGMQFNTIMRNIANVQMLKKYMSSKRCIKSDVFRDCIEFRPCSSANPATTITDAHIAESLLGYLAETRGSVHWSHTK